MLAMIIAIPVMYFLLQMLCLLTEPILVKARGISPSTTWSVTVVKVPCWNVDTMALEFTIVCTLKMLVYDAMVRYYHDNPLIVTSLIAMTFHGTVYTKCIFIIFVTWR